MAQMNRLRAGMIRGALRTIEKAAFAAAEHSTRDTREAVAITLRDVHHAVERLLCALVRAESEGGR